MTGTFKFHYNDRVRVVDAQNFYYGSVGSVSHVDRRSSPDSLFGMFWFSVNFGNDTVSFMESQLEKVDE